MAAPIDRSATGSAPDAFQELLDTVATENLDYDRGRLRAAYLTGDEAHQGQERESRRPYIVHPLAVANIVAGLRMDEDSVIAAILHDTLEDTPLTADQIEARFGAAVLALVEGVTKLRLNIAPQATARQRAAAETRRAAESLRKMLLAMANDPRVMVIKLADRLHNMQTIESLQPERQTRIAQETHEIYAPLAARLGIWQVKWQLEDLVFKTLHPKEYREVTEMVARSRAEREAEIDSAIEELKKLLPENGIDDAEIYGRAKHLFSIFTKMRRQGVEFDEITDLLALRIIVDTKAACYAALGVVHSAWHPIGNLFFDYIAMPKPNGYQSLHTKVMGRHGQPMEVQIRTEEMHNVAELGVAAHWAYKEGADRAHHAAKMAQLREQLFDWSSDSRLSSDFLRTVSNDLFSEQVFVFTPKGDVIDLPKDSTPIDFAFRVHTDVGLKTVGAKVNGTIVPLDRSLENGQVIELLTRSNAEPNLDWLEFTKSAHARNKIRAYFRKRDKSVNAQRGKEALERELRGHGVDAKTLLGEESLSAIAKTIRQVNTTEDLLAQVGAGVRSAQSVANRLRGLDEERQGREPFKVKPGVESKPESIEGIDGVLTKRAKCCGPVPGDDVMGYVTRGRGIMIHRKVCPNAQNLLDTEPERIKPLRWSADGKAYSVTLSIVTVNRQGLLMDISTVFGESKTNVVDARISTQPNNTAEIEITIEVEDLKQLRETMGKISSYSDVISVLRAASRRRK